MNIHPDVLQLHASHDMCVIIVNNICFIFSTRYVYMFLHSSVNIRARFEGPEGTALPLALRSSAALALLGDGLGSG
jgi:hypothetical protein